MAFYEVAVLTSYTTRPETSNQSGHSIPDPITQRESRHADLDFELATSIKSTEPTALSENPCSEFPKNAEKQSASNNHLSSVEFAESVTGLSLSSISSWTNSSEPFLTDSSLAGDDLCSTKNEFEGLTFTPVSMMTLSGTTNFDAMILRNKSDELVSTSPMFPTTSGVDSPRSELDLLLAKVAGDIAALQRAPDDGGIDRIACHLLDRENGNFENLPVLPFQPVHSKMENVTTESNPYFSALSSLSDSDLFSTAPCQLNEHDENSSSAFSSCRVSRSSSHCDLHDIASHASDDNFGDVESADHEAIIARVRKLRPRVKSRTPLPSMFTPPQTRGESGNPDMIKPLLLDLESLYGGSETGCGRNSSGYCDSPAPSSVCSDYEFSFLNPLSKPFVPRSRVNDASALSQQLTEDSDDNSALAVQPGLTLNVNVNCQSRVVDSGLEQTHAWNTTDCSRVNAPQHHIYDDSAYPSDSHACTFHVSMNQTSCTDAGHHRECLRLNTEHELPPYVCKIQHGDEFVSINELLKSQMIEAFWNSQNLETILSISQRVVKLKVNKFFSLDLFKKPKVDDCSSSTIFSYQDPDEPLLDHYGTGFAYDVDGEYVRIRTHRKVVDNPAEAKNTEVTFTLALTGGETIKISCRGLETGFHSNAHSDSTTFTCPTPPELLKHLHLFGVVPVLRRTSLFNDSCYFSDSSPDTSLIEREESSSDHVNIPSDLGSKVQVSQMEKSGTSPQLTYAEICKKRTASNNKNGPCRGRADCSSYGGDVETRNATRQDKASDRLGLPESCKTAYEDDDVITGNNLFNVDHEIMKFLQRDSLIRRAFETAPDGNSCESVKPVPTSSEPRGYQTTSRVGHTPFPKLGEVSSPLGVLEKRFKISGPCPYTGENTFGSNGLYTNFSSYSGDVMSPSLVFPHCTTPEMFAPWSYESLIYLQSHRREAYDKQYNTGSRQQLIADAFRNESCETSERENGTTLETRAKQCSHDIVIAEETQAIKEVGESTQNALGSLNGSNITHPTSVGVGGIHRVHCRCEEIIVQTAAPGVFHELDDVESYLNTWDKVLLNLDENLNPLPELASVVCAASHHDLFLPQFTTGALPCKVSPGRDPNQLIDEDFLEKMVRDLTADADDRTGHPSLDTTACCQKSYFDDASSQSPHSKPLAVIISHPHGGQKMVSCGRFSGHCHTGGDLYDVPTCMGSCGAPVIAVSGKGGELYVTQLVHAGTTRVSGISSGFGVSCF